MKIFLSLFLLLLLPTEGPAAPPPLEARLLVSNPAPYRGEEVTLTLEVRRQGVLRQRPILVWPKLDDFLREDLTPLLPRRESGSAGDLLVESGRCLLRPLKPGALHLSGGGVTLGDDFIAAPPLMLRVRALPERGRPAGFTGAVGRYGLTLRGDGTGTREVRLEVRGGGGSSNLPLPRAIPGSGERLVPLGDDLSMSAGKALRTLRYLYLPGEGKRGTLAFTLATFDPREGRYRVLRALLDPPPRLRGAIAFLMFTGLAAAAALCSWGLRLRRRRDLDLVLTHLLGRPSRGLPREEIAATLLRSGVQRETLAALGRLWEEEDCCRFSPAGGGAENLPSSRRRLALRLWNDVDKSRRIP